MRVSAGPSGWVKVVGRSLAFTQGECRRADDPTTSDTGTALRLSPVGAAAGTPTGAATIAVTSATCFDISARLPAGVPAGRYTVQVRNALSGWVPVPGPGGILTVAAPLPTPTTVFTATTASGLLHALHGASASGGGIVQIPRGVPSPARGFPPEGGKQNERCSHL